MTIFINTSKMRQIKDIRCGTWSQESYRESALTNGITDAAAVSDLWLEKASYLRLDNATLAYNFKNIRGISNLRAYVSANNLFVITPYKGLDPEIANGDTNQAFIDVSYGGQGFYPKTRTISLGISVSFQQIKKTIGFNAN